MVRAFSTLLLFCLTCLHAAQATTEQFDAANKLYETGKYTEAADAYKRLIAGGQTSPAIFFNLGNACFRAGNTGEAVLAYRKAQELTPRDPDVRANLSFAREQVRGPRWEASRWERFLNRLSLNEWTVMACGALWLLFTLLILTKCKESLKPVLRTWTWVAAGAVLLLFVLVATSWHIHRGRIVAVVVAEETPVRNGPLEESQTAFTVGDGAELLVADRKDKWVMVSAGAGRAGWVPASALRFN